MKQLSNGRHYQGSDLVFMRTLIQLSVQVRLYLLQIPLPPQQGFLMPTLSRIKRSKNRKEGSQLIEHVCMSYCVSDGNLSSKLIRDWQGRAPIR